MYIITVQRKGTILYTIYGGTSKRKAKDNLDRVLRQEAEISQGRVEGRYIFIGSEIHKTLSFHKLMD